MTVWRRGMLAVCVNASDCPVRGTRCPFQEGQVYRVEKARAVKDDFGRYATDLGFIVNGAKVGWNADCFRPAVEDIQPCEDEFKALIKHPNRIPEKV